jgi:hypothetical protein
MAVACSGSQKPVDLKMYSPSGKHDPQSTSPVTPPQKGSLYTKRFFRVMSVIYRAVVMYSVAADPKVLVSVIDTTSDIKEAKS